MTTAEHSFQSLMEQHYLHNLKEEISPLHKVKTKAWERFLNLGLPNSATENYRYVGFRSFFGQEYLPSIPTLISKELLNPYFYPNCATLVFVNGHYQPLLSQLDKLPKQLVVTSAKEAMRTYSAFLNNQWSRILQEESDPFAVLNAALHRDSLFLYVPPKAIVETPIQILHFIDTKPGTLFLVPRVHLFVGAHARIKVISNTVGIHGKSYCLNHALDLVMEENSQVIYNQVAVEHPAEAWHFDAFRAVLKRNSNLKVVSLTHGAATQRQDYRISLVGENAEVSLNGLWELSEKREAHTHVLMEHHVPHCRSMQLFKGVLHDYSHSSFGGKILVKREAQKTEAYQLNSNLILGERAHADSKPTLEIFADDVKASHGATVGQLDPDHLFYLRSRGLTTKEAQQVLVNGFCQEIKSQLFK